MTTLGYALLAMLAQRPQTGYDLAQTLRKPVGFFWHARHSQIYPELARLESDGMVIYELVKQAERPDKKVYTITDKGKEAVAHWATEPISVPGVRDELVLKAYAIWLADPQQALALFREHEKLHVERLAEYEGYEREILRHRGNELERIDSPMFSLYTTLKRGLGFEREYAEWCRWMIDAIEQRSGER